MADSNARSVADYIITFSREHGDPVSNLKLQKLLYYAQAWYLAIYDKPLFDERIEAWVHGPAVPPVYGAFKEWSWRPIESDCETPSFPEDVENHIDEVLDVYGGLSAFDLEKLTHSEEPWRAARGGLPPDEPSNNAISLERMKAFYRARLNGQNQSR